MAPSRTEQRSVPLWEKEFCVKVGLFRWEEFVRAKKRIHDYHNVMAWDDSAIEEAFNNAKETFKAQYFVDISDSKPANVDNQSVVDWFTETSPELLQGIGTCPEDLAISGDDDEDVLCHCKADIVDYSRIKDDEPLLKREKGFGRSACKYCSVPKDLSKIKDDGTLIGEKGLSRLEYQKEQGGHDKGEIYNIRFSADRRNWFQRIVHQISCMRRYK